MGHHGMEVVVTGASVETTLELWASSLREVTARMRPLFSQERVAASANSFLDGLLGDERRKTGWMRAEAADDAGPWRQQAILGRGRWDADALRDVVRDYAIEHLGANDAVLVIDEIRSPMPSPKDSLESTGQTFVNLRSRDLIIAYNRHRQVARGNASL